MKSYKKTIIASLATIGMSCALLGGATFALFTDDDSANIAITSGKVQVTAKVTDYTTYTDLYGVRTDGDWLEGGSVAVEDGNVTLSNIVPGDGVDLTLEVTNESTVAIKYQVRVGVEGSSALFNDLEVTIGDYELIGNGSTKSSAWTELGAGAEIGDLKVSIYYPEECIEQHLDEAECKVVLTVAAVQGNAKTPNPIDTDAVWENLMNKPSTVWSKSSGNYADYLSYVEIETEEELIVFGATDHKLYHPNNHRGDMTTVKITKDLDFFNYEWTPLISENVIFDGNNCTISNINMGKTNTRSSDTGAWRGGFVALSTNVGFKNLTFKNVTVSGAQVGVLAGLWYGSEYSSIENVTLAGKINVTYVPYSTEDYTEEYGGIGAFIGVLGSGTLNVNGATVAEDAVVTLNLNNIETVITNISAQRLFGYIASGTVNASDVKVEGGVELIGIDKEVEENGNWHIYTAQGLVDFGNYFDSIPSNDGRKGMTNKVVTLEASIDLAGIDWQPIGLAQAGQTAFKGTFDGQNYKISNLSINKAGTKYVGFFAQVGETTGTVKNVVFENATVIGGQMTGVVVGRFGTNNNAPTMENVTVQGEINVTGGYQVGAVIGSMGGKCDNITVDASSNSLVKGTYDVGGIAGVTKAGNGLTEYKKLSTNISLEATSVPSGDSTFILAGGLVGREGGGNKYYNCTVTCNIKAPEAAEPYSYVNACFGDITASGTTVDGFTFEGTITGGTFTGFCYSHSYEITFTNSTATVTRDGTTTVHNADASGNITTK